MEHGEIIHPNEIIFNGYTFKVSAFCRMTEAQARMVVVTHYRMKKLRPGKGNPHILIRTQYTQETLALLGGRI